MIEGVSRRAFGGSAGTYNVHASELAHTRGVLKTLSATVVFLDDTVHTFRVDKHAKGETLLEEVFQHLELVEKDYFGLQYTENGLAPSLVHQDLIRWLDPNKQVKKQIRNGGNFYFRVKFYVSDPSKLQEEYTRYHFYLQIRKDILAHRLILAPSTACLLASYTVQSELGDYHPDEHKPGYLSGLSLIPGQTEEMEEKIEELHKLHKGQSPADAEYNYLEHAKRCEMYGVAVHGAKDSQDRDIQLGVTANGLVIFHAGARLNLLSWTKIVKISFKRKQFFVQLKREPSETYDTLLGFNMTTYRSCKNLWKSCVEHHTFFRLHSPRRSRKFLPPPLSLGSKFFYSGRTEYQTYQQARRSVSTQRSFIRSRSTQRSIQINSDDTAKASRPLRYDNKVTSLGSREPKRAWDPPHPSDDEGGFLDKPPPPGSLPSGSGGPAPTPSTTLEEEGPAAILPARTTLNFVDDDVEEEVRSPVYEENKPASPHLHLNLEDGLVLIRIAPDEQGRFGFNVKGGADLGMPILVSRVAPNTPAYTSYPKLNEGDQVVLINGSDVSGMHHEQVVSLIRTSRDTHGELVLTVRPNVYEAGGGGEDEEPPYQYVPESSLGPSAVGGQGGALAQSMLLLADGLASGALVAQFERLYRKKPGMSMLHANKQENVIKNRYRDISPYDASRVILHEAPDGDYINANTVSMEIPGSGIVNRYIATQGPLASTVGDFWHMLVEAGSTLVVMVTTLVERGRTKCHKYWPSLGETLELSNGRFNISCAKEEADPSGSFVFREFVLRDSQTGEKRDVTQMQYLAWPDHGVPDDVNRFLAFTRQVRHERSGMVEPAIVHCSAGIGRTGVLILMETAMCLIEANQPVYPLEICRQMRNQRAMMIQTPSQYKFVCSCVHHAYTEELVKPLPELNQLNR
ncbi:hypothetical protein WDU94_008182 [Cyamophila willieti]